MSRGPHRASTRRCGTSGSSPTVTPSGAKNAIVTGFNSLSNPDLVLAADGSLRVFFGGLSTPANSALNTATAPATVRRGASRPARRRRTPPRTLAERCRHHEGRNARLGMGDDVWNASPLRYESRRRRRRGADADPVLRLLPRRRHGRHRRQSRHRLVLERQRRGGPRHAGDRGHRAGRPQAVRPGHGRRYARRCRSTSASRSRHARAAACTSATPPATRRPLMSTSGSTGQRRPRSRSRRRAPRT